MWSSRDASRSGSGAHKIARPSYCSQSEEALPFRGWGVAGVPGNLYFRVCSWEGRRGSSQSGSAERLYLTLQGPGSRDGRVFYGSSLKKWKLQKDKYLLPSHAACKWLSRDEEEGNQHGYGTYSASKSLTEVVFAPSAEEIQGGLGTTPTSRSDEEAGLAVGCRSS